MKPTSTSPSHLLPMLAVLATLELAWLGWFLLEPLPNAGNVGGNGLCRWNLLIRGFPHVIPGLKLQESYLGLALRELSHVENLPGRLPIVLAASLIAMAAVTLGRLVGRSLGLGLRVAWWESLAISFGLGTTGLGLLAMILGRVGLLNPALVRVGLWVPIVVEAAFLIASRQRGRGDVSPSRFDLRAMVGFSLLAAPFLVIMLLGAMLPTVDFDAIEYHLQGPKEYYQNGRITFLPHNVYTSMPFSIEMLHLIGMEVVDDWWLGALVGQVLVALFAPAAAILIGSAASRIGSARAGWVAAVVYLTTPWIYRLAALPYVEGPLCYFHAALIWAVVMVETRSSVDPPRPFASGALVGLLAGGSMAIKYPALISAVIPFAAWSVYRSWTRRSWRVALGFVLGVALVMTPWLAKNVIDTGNPVYPLGYKVFKGRHWNPDQDAKWSAAHGSKPVEVISFFRSIVDVAGRSDWQSPLFAALAPLAWLRGGSRKATGWLWAFAAYIFLTWWLFTHRLDRFWLPILAPLAVLAGLGADWVRSVFWTTLLSMVLGLAIVTNAVYCSTALAGLNQWTGDLAKLRSSVPEMINPPLTRLDASLPIEARPLLVGQAAVFHLNHPVVYNTVFNLETIETLTRGRSPDQVREAFARLGVTHVYVDWFEVERYRSPGNYGYTPYVKPEVFARLIELGILDPPTRLGLKQELYKVRGVPPSRR